MIIDDWKEPYYRSLCQSGLAHRSSSLRGGWVGPLTFHVCHLTIPAFRVITHYSSFITHSPYLSPNVLPREVFASYTPAGYDRLYHSQASQENASCR